MKNKISAVLILLLLSSCEIYDGYEKNQDIQAFLNLKLNHWLKEEDRIIQKYSSLIVGETFSSEEMLKNIETFLLPYTLRLRDEIAEEKIENEPLKKIQSYFIAKLDILLEGFSLIADGLKEKDKETFFEMIFKGRDKIKEIIAYNNKIKEIVDFLMEKYFIKSKKEGKENGS